MNHLKTIVLLGSGAFLAICATLALSSKGLDLEFMDDIPAQVTTGRDITFPTPKANPIGLKTARYDLDLRFEDLKERAEAELTRKGWNHSVSLLDFHQFTLNKPPFGRVQLKRRGEQSSVFVETRETDAQMTWHNLLTKVGIKDGPWLHAFFVPSPSRNRIDWISKPIPSSELNEFPDLAKTLELPGNLKADVVNLSSWIAPLNGKPGRRAVLYRGNNEKGETLFEMVLVKIQPGETGHPAMDVLSIGYFPETLYGRKLAKFARTSHKNGWSYSLAVRPTPAASQEEISNAIVNAIK